LPLFDHFDFVSSATVRQSYPDGSRTLLIQLDSRNSVRTKKMLVIAT
jgi:hypothetical protein